MNITGFLKTVWPASGIYCIATPSPKGSGYWHKTFTSIGDAVSFSKTQRDQLDVFFAVHSLKQRRVAKASGGWSYRIRENMEEARAFFFDLDVGQATEENDKYGSQLEARNDLQRFLFLSGLPNPLVTSSGGGLHVYWPLTDPIKSDDWRAEAAKLKAIASHLGLKYDPMRTTDVTSVLRVPMTYNHKKGQKRPVVVLHDGEISDTTSFTATLQKLVAQWKLVPRSGRSGSAPPPGAPAHAANAGNLADPLGFTGTITSLKSAYNACGQLRRYIKHQDKAPNPWWYNMLGLLRCLTHGDKLIHKFSNKHPDYDYAFTVAEAKRFATSTGNMPPSCQKIESVMGNKACLACPFYGKVKNPLLAGEQWKMLKASPPAPTEPKPVVEPPRNHTLSDAGIIYDKYDEKLKTTKPIRISNYKLFPYEDINKVNNDDAITNWWARMPRDAEGWKSITLSRRSLGDSTALFSELSNEGIIITDKHKQDMKAYMIAYIQKLQLHQDTLKQYDHLGWAEKRTKFVLPNIIYQVGKQPTQGRLSKMLHDVNEWIGTAGSMKAQIAAMKFYDEEQYLAHQFVIMCSLGSVIFHASEFGGAAVALSGESGGSKSTAMYAAGAIWGPPKKFVLSATSSGATTLAKDGRMVTLHNLPAIMDEMTQIDPEIVKDFALQVSQYSERERLKQDGTPRLKRSEDKSLIALISTNASLHQVLSINNIAGTANAQRIMEIPVPKYGNESKTEADAFFRAINQNYGWIGPAFLEFVCANYDAVIQAVIDRTAYFDQHWGGPSAERYTKAICAAALVAGNIAYKQGWLPYSPKRVAQWLENTVIPHQRSNIEQQQQSTDPLTIMSNYIAHINGDILRVHQAANGNRPYCENTFTPHHVKGQWDIEAQRLNIVKFDFNKYCEAMNQNGPRIVSALFQRGIVFATDKKVTLGGGTDIVVAGRARCFVLDTSKKALGGIEPLKAVGNVVPFNAKGAAVTAAP